MRYFSVFLIFILALTALPFASTSAYSEEALSQPLRSVNDQPNGMVEGQVVRIDSDMSQIVIKHRELVGLGMPAMTMVFSVTDKSLLDGISAGEKIKFAAQVAPHGLLVTKLESETN